MIHYKSNACYTPVDLKTGEFMFTFDVKNKNTTLDGSNFNLVFEIKNSNVYNKFKLTNTSHYLNTEGYLFNKSNEYILKKINSDYSPMTFFYDKIIFLNKKPLKLLDSSDTNASDYIVIDGETYIASDKYSVIQLDSKTYLKRKNALNNGLPIRPIELQLSESNSSNGTRVEYFVDNENIFDSNIPQTYRIIVADKGQLISLWQKRGNQFEKIRTFSYTNVMEKAEIYFSVDDSMILSNLKFGFFQSEHQTT